MGAGNLVADTQQMVVHPSVDRLEVSRNTARAIFSMRLKNWQDGTVIKVIVLPDAHPFHRQFTRQTLALFPHQLRRSWDRYIYSGIGAGPIEVKSEDELIDRVASTPGSIGYTSKETLNESVRILPVR